MFELNDLLDEIFFFPTSKILESTPSKIFDQKIINYPYSIYKKNNDYVIEIALAGFSKDDIKIELKEDKLTISGSKKENEEGRTYYVKGISYRDFHLTFTLRAKIDVEKIKSSFEDGLLKVILPEDKSQHRLIEIK